MTFNLKFLNYNLKFLPPFLVKILKGLYLKFSLNIFNSIVFLPTFRCNYKCPYCLVNKFDYSRSFQKKDEHHWRDWIEVFEKLPSSIIHISGGEPFLFNGFIELVNNMPRKHIIAGITTNLSFPISEFKKISKNNRRINTSFHPFGVEKEVFLKKVLTLKKIGFTIWVNIVAYPNLLKKIKSFIDYFRKRGLDVNVDPYLDPYYEYGDKEKKMVRSLVTRNRRIGFDHEDKDWKECYAGSKYIVILPNGDVYSCMAGFYYSTQAYQKFNNSNIKFFMGNLFDGSFRYKTKKMKCNLPCQEACDIESTGVKNVKS